MPAAVLPRPNVVVRNATSAWHVEDQTQDLPYLGNDGWPYVAAPVLDAAGSNGTDVLALSSGSALEAIGNIGVDLDL